MADAMRRVCLGLLLLQLTPRCHAGTQSCWTLQDVATEGSSTHLRMSTDIQANFGIATRKATAEFSIAKPPFAASSEAAQGTLRAGLTIAADDNDMDFASTGIFFSCCRNDSVLTVPDANGGTYLEVELNSPNDVIGMLVRDNRGITLTLNNVEMHTWTMMRGANITLEGLFLKVFTLGHFASVRVLRPLDTCSVQRQLQEDQQQSEEQQQQQLQEMEEQQQSDLEEAVFLDDDSTNTTTTTTETTQTATDTTTFTMTFHQDEIYDVDPDHVRCACEQPGAEGYESCTNSTTCRCRGHVKLGVGVWWTTWKKVDDAIECNVSGWNVDPYPGQPKECLCKPKSWGWRTLYTRGDYAPSKQLAEDSFNEYIFNGSMEDGDGVIIWRECKDCPAPHNSIYVRLRNHHIWNNPFQALLVTWPETGFGEDFKLYSSLNDAKLERRNWTYCNGGDPEIGFPRDCGPEDFTPGMWNSLTWGVGQFHWRFSLYSDVYTDHSEVELFADPESDGLKCGFEEVEEGDDDFRCFKFTDEEATEARCKQACREDPDCIALSAIFGEWCIGCMQSLWIEHQDALAFKKIIATTTTTTTAAEVATTSGAAADCILPAGQLYSPDMTGQGRTVEASAELCQARCADVSGCAYFSWWGDGGCHLQDGSATLTSGSTAAAGPAKCDSVDCSSSMGGTDCSNELGDWAGPNTCVSHVSTDHGTCKQYCSDRSLTCARGMDDSGSCSLNEAGHSRQTEAENGCLQEWSDQICACTSPAAAADATSASTTASTTRVSVTLSTPHFGSDEELVKFMQEEAAIAVDAKDAEEKAAVQAFLAAVVNGRITESAVRSTESMTCAVMSAETIAASGGVLDISAPADATGFSPKVAVTAGTLSALGDNGTPVALTASAIDDDLQAIMENVLSKGQEGENSEATPTLATRPLSVSLFTLQGDPMKAQLAEPILLTLAPLAPPNVSCAFWDTEKQAWSSEGVERVINETYNSDEDQPLVCATMHLSIFAGIVGIFEDIIQTIVCSNLGAVFQGESLKNIFITSDWASEPAAITLWVFSAVCFLVCMYAIRWDYLEAQEAAQLLAAQRELSPRERFMLEAKKKKEAEEKEIEDLEEDEEKPGFEAKLQNPVILAVTRFCIDILSASWQALMKVTVKALRLPNSVHTLLLSLPDAPEQFVKMCARRGHAKNIGVHQDSLKKMVEDFDVDDVEASASKADGDDGTTAMIRDGYVDALDTFLDTWWLGRAMQMIVATHPWMIIVEYSSYVSHSARVVLCVAEILGSVMVNAVFFQVTGGALSRHLPQADDCQPRPGILTEIIQSFTVATVGCLFADFFVAFLASVRFVDFEGIEALPALERAQRLQDMKYRIGFFWVLSIIYLVFCMTILMSFLANVTVDDATDWLIASAMSVTEDFIIIPVAFGFSLAIIASVFLRYSHKVGELKDKVKTMKSMRTLNFAEGSQGKATDLQDTGEDEPQTNAAEADEKLLPRPDDHPPPPPADFVHPLAPQHHELDSPPKLAQPSLHEAQKPAEEAEQELPEAKTAVELQEDSLEETPAMQRSLRKSAQVFDQIDIDKSGDITQTELGSLDANGDGRVTESELTAVALENEEKVEPAEPVPVVEAKPTPQADLAASVPAAPHPKSLAHSSTQEAFKEMDLNKDGVVSKEEYQIFMRKKMAELGKK
mmetsp:Transcript_50304/g.90305  ORF Transcript_50304/g.90305 Transcript_50304/m.90305 type:complete len:1674 (-) Transcript_50304:291-5312(-)